MTRVRAMLPILVLTVAMGASACAKKVPPPVPAPPPPAPAAPAPPPPPPPPPAPRAAATPPSAPGALSEDEVFARKSLEQLNAERPLEDVYFNLDESEIRADARAALQKNSDWLKRWSSAIFAIEGHCDSRGSAEYNLGLGSRRATAVKDYLVSLGVPAARVTIVSKGKEQPFCNQEEESCWQQNRRGHFVITGK
jgi:peptidoglycan-associated lipoprotein